MNPTKWTRRLIIQGGAILASWITAQTAGAGIIVDLSANPIGGGVFQYDFSISNSGPEDVVIVSITDAPAGDPLIAATLTTPPGFIASYDSGVMVVDFLEDTDLFAAGATYGGFGFQSLASPVQNFTMFEALSISGDIEMGQTHLIQTPVPEPGAWLTTSVGLLALVLARRKLSAVNPIPKNTCL